MELLIQNWHKHLSQRAADHALRRLHGSGTGVDFKSNDYLGLAHSPEFGKYVSEEVAGRNRSLLGATGSRLVCGNSPLAEEVEAFIAREHHAKAALFFPSGYKANLALFSCMLGRSDTIILDELIHRSIHDGCALSSARKWKFRHNDLNDLERLLKKAKGHIVVAIESLYSVDGDFAPVPEILALVKQYRVSLVVDEAHAMGVFGKGIVHRYSLQKEVLATIVTYGKAMGVQGAAILGSNTLKQYLINFATPFIYSTGPPDVQLLAVKAAYEYAAQHSQLASALETKIDFFRGFNIHKGSEEGSPVQIVCFTGQDELYRAYQALNSHYMQVYPLFAPTVPAGRERLRICIHAFNTDEEIASLCNTVKQYDYIT